MTLVAGRMPGLPSLERRLYAGDNMTSILKGGSHDRSPPSRYERPRPPQQPAQRTEDGKRLVRFCDAKEIDAEDKTDIDPEEAEREDVIMFGNNKFIINNSDPNSAVRKLFPNSKLMPINPFQTRKDTGNSNRSQITKVADNHNLFSQTRMKNSSEDLICNPSGRKVERTVLKRNTLKVPPETKPKPGKAIETSTPLIERIKQLTCNQENILKKDDKFQAIYQAKMEPFRSIHLNVEPSQQYQTLETNKFNQFQAKPRDLLKDTKEGLNLMRYNTITSQTRSELPPQKTPSQNQAPNKSYMTDEAKRSFLYSLSQANEPRDRTSVATNSTNDDTVYSLSDIEEVLTEEEKEIKDAFFKENKQDELELFVQQDAGRTERLRKRYNSMPKLENTNPVLNPSFPSRSTSNVPHVLGSNLNCKKERPKFGSTIEILQQLQQQIETPYQLEGRRTACSNYSDSSIPLSERLFCDESSDGYEPINPKLNIHRAYSLDSKNYEEIDNYPSAFSVPRTQSHEHPYLTHLQSDPYFYSPSAVTRSSDRHRPIEQNRHASYPDLCAYNLTQHTTYADRFSSYNHHPPGPGVRQLHPVLQRQYCRYPVNEPQRPVEEDKILTPPIRMHTYMNVPSSAPCYPSPPPYSRVNHYTSPPPHPHSDAYYDSPHHSNIYQNVPLPQNPQMALRSLCTERERGVPEGASSTHDSKELYSAPTNDYYFSPNLATIPKLSSVPYHYCVDV